MGWAARASAGLEVRDYRVRRWTAFHDAPSARTDDRRDHLTRMAAIIERKLVDMYPKREPRVLLARVDGQPQLLFEMRVPGSDARDASRRALHGFERGLSARVALRYGRRGLTRLTPPWGKTEVEAI